MIAEYVYLILSGVEIFIEIFFLLKKTIINKMQILNLVYNFSITKESNGSNFHKKNPKHNITILFKSEISPKFGFKSIRK